MTAIDAVNASTLQLLNALRDAIGFYNTEPPADPDVALLTEIGYRLRELDAYQERWHRLVTHVDTVGQAMGWLDRDLKAIRASGALQPDAVLDMQTQRMDQNPAVRMSVLQVRAAHAEAGVAGVLQELAAELPSGDGYVRPAVIEAQRTAQLNLLRDWQRERDDAQRELDDLRAAMAPVPDPADAAPAVEGKADAPGPTTRERLIPGLQA